MKRSFTLLAAMVLGLGLGSTAMAAVEDADGDGVYSLEELMVAYPALTKDVFATIDSNGDGAVDEDELAMAVDAGVLVAG